jgi:hypothetical protein
VFVTDKTGGDHHIGIGATKFEGAIKAQRPEYGRFTHPAPQRISLFPGEANYKDPAKGGRDRAHEWHNGIKVTPLQTM